MRTETPTSESGGDYNSDNLNLKIWSPQSEWMQQGLLWWWAVSIPDERSRDNVRNAGNSFHTDTANCPWI